MIRWQIMGISMKHQVGLTPSSETNISNAFLWMQLDYNQMSVINSLLTELVRRKFPVTYFDAIYDLAEISKGFFTIVNEVTAAGGIPMGIPGSTFRHFLYIHADLLVMLRDITVADPLYEHLGYQLLIQNFH